MYSHEITMNTQTRLSVRTSVWDIKKSLTNTWRNVTRHVTIYFNVFLTCILPLLNFWWWHYVDRHDDIGHAVAYSKGIERSSISSSCTYIHFLPLWLILYFFFYSILLWFLFCQQLMCLKWPCCLFCCSCCCHSCF